ncbi:unnamed protein product [Candidula unifasciata]|uniref:ATP synthase F1 subunit epsilon n=1 Tax=Candidula unifasciata TaxID=100452 RepID=A0A8S3ZNN3_9EUPU|nr:unnamed protein product [Candidula unifasciata]
MAARLPVILRSLQSSRIICARAMSGGQLGDGVGKGGGGIGSIREAGGAFAKMEVAKEEQYFRQLQKEQFERLKELLEDEVSHHELQIKQHLAAIEHHKKKIERLHKKDKHGEDSD